MRRCLIALLMLAATLHAASFLPEITGKSSTYDLNTQETVIAGDAQLVYGDAVLTADEIRFNRNTNIATADGRVVLTHGTQRLLTDHLTYRLSDGFFQVGRVRLGEYPFYVSADSAAGTKAKITFKNAYFTLHEPNPFTPTVHAETLVYEPGKFLSADGNSVGVGPVRPLILPHFNQRIEDNPLLSDFTADAGYRSNLGPYAGVGLELPVMPDAKLGGSVDYYIKRGVLLSPVGRYGYSGPDEDISGYFRGGFIDDHGDKGTDILDRPVPNDRGFFEWQHQQFIDDKITLLGDVNYWSDSYIIRDFDPKKYNPVQMPDNFVEADYSGHNYVLSAFTRFDPNNFELTQQRLPEIRFDLLPITVGAGFDERFSASAAVLRQDPLPTGGPALTSTRYDAFYGIGRPVTPTNWFTFTPIAGGRLTYYTNTDGTGGRDAYLRGLGEVGFDADLRTSGTWDYKNDRWQIDGLRHLFTPKISYRYIPEAEEGQRYIPPIDIDTFSPYLQPLELGDTRNIDQLHRTDTVRLELDNTLQTRDPHYGSRDLFSLNLAEDFHFSRDPGEYALSQTEAELSASPVNWLQFNALEIFVPQYHQENELDTGFSIRDGEQRSFGFSNSFLRGQIEQYNFQYTERLNEEFEVVETFSYDARLRQVNQQVVELRQNIRNTWVLHYEIAFLNGDTRQGHFGLNVAVDLIKF